MHKAISEFEKALEIDPNFIRAGDANAAIGLVYFTLDDNKKARLYANNALAIEEDNVEAVNLISKIDKEEAEQQAKQKAEKEFREKYDNPTQLFLSHSSIGIKQLSVGNTYFVLDIDNIVIDRSL
jgi:tetratricopeptide (TPR) repeat protein